MKFSPVKKVILFGGSHLLLNFARLVKKSGLEVVVFSYKRHLEEAVEGNSTLAKALQSEHIRVYKSPDIRSGVLQLKKEISASHRRVLGVSFGATWGFPLSIVSLFPSGNLLDFMGIDLPRYRGGAHYTWQILNGNRKGCVNMQIILGDGDAYQKGPLVKRREYALPAHLKIPADFFAYIGAKETDFLKEFWRELKSGKNFELHDLDESKSSYYPFLHTRTQAFVNWDWSAKDIFCFINAFDDPYAGASTFLGRKKIFLKGAYILKPEERYHPFISGVVVRKDEKNIYVAAVGGLLRLTKVMDESGLNLLSKINLGERFFTPRNILEKSFKFKAVYNAKGLKK